MRCRYREVIYHCGKYVENVIYPVFKNKGGRRRKYRPTSDVQERLNRYNAEQKLRRLIETNFGEGDIWLTLTYDEKHLPGEDKRFFADYYNFIRRLNRYREKRGMEQVKAIDVPANDGRYHHHVVISGGLTSAELRKIWGKGMIWDRPLEWGDDGLQGLADYIARQSIAGKRYLRTKTVRDPEVTTREGRISQGRVRELYGLTDCPEEFEDALDGVRVTSVKSFYNTFNTHFYLRVFGVRDAGKRKTA